MTDHLTTKLSTSNGEDKQPGADVPKEGDVALNGVEKKGVTFANQDRLPNLPIPELKSTCDRYLAALKPLQSPQEHQDTSRAVEDFFKGEGPELNERLRKYATGRTSYIEQFCMYKGGSCVSRSIDR